MEDDHDAWRHFQPLLYLDGEFGSQKGHAIITFFALYLTRVGLSWQIMLQN